MSEEEKKAWEEYSKGLKHSLDKRTIPEREIFEAGQKTERERILNIVKRQKKECIECLQEYTAEMLDGLIDEIEGDKNE